MAKKRILIFSLAYYPVEGGAEIAVKEITDRIADIEFDLVTLRFDKSHQRKERVGNVNVYRIDTSKILFPIEAFLFGKKLHKDRHYTAIWSIMAAYAGFASLFFKMSFPNVPYVLTLQEGDPLDYMKKRAKFVSPLFKRIFTKADQVQAISTYLADYADIMGFKNKVEVIPNGVDVKNFQSSISNIEKKDLRERVGFTMDDFVVITTSRLVKKNAVGDVIDSLKFLPESVKFLVLGIGPLEEELKAKVEVRGLEKGVKFLGHVPYAEIPPYLHASDVFIRPSLSEGFGNSFIEAMAAGLPVIATPVGGIVDFVKDGETGLFCKVEDPASIAEQVTRIIENHALAAKLRVSGAQLAKEKYDWELIAHDMKERVFNKI